MKIYHRTYVQFEIMLRKEKQKALLEQLKMDNIQMNLLFHLPVKMKLIAA